MRFEMRAGGLFAILLGLGFLSGAVFLLGLVAGYEIGRQQEVSNQQYATVYPVPAPPAAAASPSAGATPLSPAAAATSEASPMEPGGGPPTPLANASPPAPVAPPTPAESVASAPPEEPSAEEETPVARPAAPSGRPYSIQIEAAMDRTGADAMVANLRHLGYNTYIVETEIAGQTWYRVRVGPYATEEEARAAEQRLHEQYTGGFTTR